MPRAARGILGFASRLRAPRPPEEPMTPKRLLLPLALVTGALLAFVGSAPPGVADAGGPKAAAGTATSETTYDVVQTFEVKDVPAGAKQVRAWFWMPEDRPEQKVLDFRIVSAPEGVRVTRDPAYVSGPMTGRDNR